MPRTEAVPASEIEIGRRLRDARQTLLISQTTFALKLGIGRERLASYESGRVPLPWTVGDRACRTFRINPLWLAKGDGSQWQHLGYSGPDPDCVSARALFSEWFAHLIDERPKEGKRLKSPGFDWLPSGTFPVPEQSMHANVFNRVCLEMWLGQLTPDQTEEFLKRLRTAGTKIMRAMTSKRPTSKMKSPP